MISPDALAPKRQPMEPPQPGNYDFDGLVQERRNSIANALELHLSCTNPSTSSEIKQQT